MPAAIVALALAAANFAQAAPARPAIVQVEVGNRPGGAVVAPQMFRQAQPVVPLPLPSDADLARVTIEAELLRLARALDSEQFSDRSSARSAIIARKVTPDELMALLTRHDLSEETSNALVAILRERILTAPRGALGIRMGQAPMDRPGVVIVATLTGLPAEKFLKAGDVIEEIEGVPVLTTLDLVDSIRNFAPGREIKIKLRRPDMDAQGRPLIGPDGKTNDRPVDIVMPLGNAEDLNKAEPGEFQAAQNMQLQQRALEGKMILRRFAEPASNSNNGLPAETP